MNIILKTDSGSMRVSKPVYDGFEDSDAIL